MICSRYHATIQQLPYELGLGFSPPDMMKHEDIYLVWIKKSTLEGLSRRLASFHGVHICPFADFSSILVLESVISIHIFQLSFLILCLPSITVDDA